MSALLDFGARLGGQSHPGFVSGAVYWAYRGGTASGSAVAAADTLYGYAFRIGAPVAISALLTRCATGGAGSANKAGVWRMAGGRPFGVPLLADNTGLATTGSNTTQIHSAAAGVLPDDWLFFATVYTGTLPTMLHAAVAGVEAVALTGAASLVTANQVAGLSTAFTYSGNISALNLTGASWSYASPGVPLLGFAAA